MAIKGMSRYSVAAPAFVAPVGGLLQVSPARPLPDAHAAQGISAIVDDCGHPQMAPDWCLSAIAVAGDKEFDAPGEMVGDPFAIYKGIECDLFHRAEYVPMARRGLEQGQWFPIERGVQQLLLNRAGTTVLNGGTAVTPKRAVALLEQHAGEVYAGLPTFHTSRFGTAFLDVNTDKPILTTKQFTPIANSAGHTKTGPGGVVATATQFWLYASGQVTILVGDVVESEAPNPRANVSTALAERIVVPAVECFTAAVLVTTEGQ